MVLVLLVPPQVHIALLHGTITSHIPIVLEDKLLGAIGSTEVRGAHPLQPIVEAQSVGTGTVRLIHHAVVDVLVRGLRGHFEPLQGICVTDKLSVFGHLVFDVCI